MRHPGRLRISWQDDQTLKIETDAGLQTRLLRFGRPGGERSANAAGALGRRMAVAAGRCRQSAGRPRPGATRQPPPRAGSLKVVTTNLLAGWLRKNGVPFSENAVLTEYLDRFTDGSNEWFAVTTMVEDAANLTMPFVISSNFKREPDGAKWAPAACTGS